MLCLNLKGETFNVTISLEVLNNGVRKGLLFSGAQGEMFYAYNLEAIEYKEDLVLTFEKPASSPVHLTIYLNNNFIPSDSEKIYMVPSTRTPITTYTFIPNNFILLEPNDRRHIFSEGRLIMHPGEKQTLRITGIHKLNDEFLHNPYCKIVERRIRKDSMIKVKFRHPEGEDISGFIRVNDEPFYRHIFIPVEEAFPKRLHIENLEIASENSIIRLPYKGDWKGNITCENLESGYLCTMTDFIINGSFTKNKFEFPISDNVVLDDFLITISDWNQYGRERDTMHFFSKLFRAPKTDIFYNRNFDFNIEGIKRGFELERLGEFDLFEVEAYVRYKEDESNNPNVYQRNSLNAYRWKVKTATTINKNSYTFIFPKIVPEIATFLKLPKNLGGFEEVKFGDLEFVKFELPLDENFLPSNVSLYQASFKDSIHKIVVKRHDANEF